MGITRQKVINTKEKIMEGMESREIEMTVLFLSFSIKYMPVCFTIHCISNMAS